MKVPAKITQATTAIGKSLKANSPKIFLGIGIAASILAVVDAVYQTTKVMDDVEDHKNEVESIKERRKSSTVEEYSEKDYKKDIFQLYVRTGGKIAKRYLRAIILEALAIFSVCKSFNIMESRQQMLTTALAAAIDSAMDDRRKVAEAIGQEEADKIFNGVTEQKYIEEVVDENGKTKKLKGKREVVDPKKVSALSFIWGEGDPGWDEIFEYNENTVIEIEKFFNRKLFGERKDNGEWRYCPVENYHVSYNDITNKFLGSKAWTQLGQAAGCDKNHPDGYLKLRYRRVAAPWPEGEGMTPTSFRDALLITPNIPGSIIPDFVATE